MTPTVLGPPKREALLFLPQFHRWALRDMGFLKEPAW